MRLLFLAAALLLAPPAHAFSPGEPVCVVFKDGTSVTAVLASLSGDMITLRLGGGESSWPMSSVAQVSDAAPPPSPAPPEPDPPADPSTRLQPAYAAPPSPVSPALAAPAPPTGFAAPGTPPPAAYYALPVGFLVSAPRRSSDDQAFLRRQAAEREARRHRATTPQQDFQFALQQAIDRGSRGLPFAQPTR